MTMTRFEIRNRIKQSKLGWRGRIQAQYTNVLRTENNQSRGSGGGGVGAKAFHYRPQTKMQTLPLAADPTWMQTNFDVDPPDTINKWMVHILPECILVTIRKWSCRKVMFSQECVKNSVHRGGGVYPNMHWALDRGGVYPSMHWAGVCVSQHALGVSAWGVSAKRGVPSGPEADTPRDGHPLPDGHCSGRYASYWNAFLFGMIFAETCM